jgi:flagellin-specific chaperone FliS
LNKIIKYINENSVETIIASVVKKEKDPYSVIQQVSDANVELTKKAIEIRHELEKLLPDKIEFKVEVGDTIEAIVNFMNGRIVKGNQYKATSVDGIMITLDTSYAQISNHFIQRNFIKIEV